jgi:uncharacterized membrane protein HdeD (DUF308 family)
MDSSDLLDYALGQLDGPPRERLEDLIASDPALAERLVRLARRLGRLLDDGRGGETDDDPVRTPPPRDDPATAAVVVRFRQRRERWTTVILLARNWWALAWRGLVAVLFGAMALAWPGPTLTALALLFGAFALLDGTLVLAAATVGRCRGPSWGALLAEGWLGIAAGVLALSWPWLMALALVYVIAGWALVTGTLEIAAAVRLRGEIEGEWLLGLCGGLSILFGLALGLWPGAAAVALAWLIGAYALAFGVLVLALAFRLRAWARNFPPLGV